MRKRSLTSRLISIGTVAGRRGESGGVRYVALLLATFVLAVGLAALAAVDVGYGGKHERAQARTPIPASANGGAKADLLLKYTSDDLEDHRAYDVVLVSPSSRDAPVPPGVRRWPKPGEFLGSPALLREGAAEGISKRYGKLAGSIGQEGLADPSERLVFVNPVEELTSGDTGVQEIAGFGGSTDPPFSGTYYTHDSPKWALQLLVAILVVVPGLALTLVAARTGSHSRDRRIALITALGGRRGDRAWLSVGEAWRPVVWGSSAAALAVAVPAIVDVRIPVTGYVLSSADLRESAGWLGAAVLAAGCLVLATTVYTNRHKRVRRSRRGGASTRPVGVVRRSLWLWALLCPVCVATAVYFSEVLFPPRTPPSILVKFASIAGTAVTLPAVIASATILVGWSLARVGLRRRRPAPLVAGRRIANHFGPTARLIAGLTVGIFVFLQAVAWQGNSAKASIATERASQEIGHSAVHIENEASELGTEKQIQDFLDRLPTHVASLALTTAETEDGDDLKVIHGECRDIRSAGLACRDGVMKDVAAISGLEPWLRTAIYGYVSEEELTGGGMDGFFSPLESDVDSNSAKVMASENGDSSPKLLLFDTRGRELDVPELKRVAYQALPEGASIDLVGETVGAAERDQSNWSLLLGIVAVSIAAAASALSAVAEFLRHGRALAPLTVLTGGYRIFRVNAIWMVSLAMCLATVVSLAVGTWLAKPFDQGGFVSPGLVSTVLVTTLALSGAMSVWAGQIAVRQARQWRPSGLD
ncbi:hypothetical protein Snas_5123 [Stackebrandtia nassauensis DSM 44728]|uniref:Permease n=1 Tax=Stackebrandtia nassauensis (strain DSM 44728 / CIP 108903 / NRRL B-16338 / NBRC 102104 / LLR-40K-21) TaxID=446470 RepID=D3QAW2_STANL|nr:hypothetical protein Snas_5123 [Stackebrandtia nassauensis DSM 44728]